MKKENIILVVGSNGLLGQELMVRLQPLGQVIGIDIDTCDITEPEQIERVIESVQPDWVINSAAVTDVDGCEANPAIARTVNVIGTANLARACRDREIGIVQLSTDFVFDGKKGGKYNEDDTPSPLSIYGETKLGGEREVIKAAGKYIIVRTSWLFGKGGKNFPDTILNAARKKDSLKVVSDQTGSPTSAIDLAAAIGELIRKDARGIVHVTNRGSCSWAEYAEFVVKISGLETEIIPISAEELGRPAARPGFSVLSTERYEKITGKKMRPWQDAVKSYLIFTE
ncbi:MAG: dTDP-4-dehydrorhamnose reductase [Candidatus Auribacterota bacterium]|nr:dTDP-4-dehydrorhamnose reductase [Candidatus Auribacterota bacterium]